MLDFNKIVKILWKKWWKVMFKSDIYELIDPELKPEYQSRVDKTIYKLRSEWLIVSLKSGVYIIPDAEDTKLNEVDLLEKYYLSLLKKYITQEVWNQYYISGKKSLEFHMKDFSLPKRITVITRNLQKKIQVWDYEIYFRTITGGREKQGKSLFSFLFQYHKTIDISGIEFKVSWLELAILESAIIEDGEQGVSIDLLSRVLKKYHHVLKHDIFREIGKYKYNMSYNRLKELSRHIAPELYELFLDIIKKNGGCFVGEGLRNM